MTIRNIVSTLIICILTKSITVESLRLQPIVIDLGVILEEVWGNMEIQDILGYLLNVSAKMIKRTMDKSLAEYSITTSQWSVLKLLNSRGELTQTQIALELRGDKATVGEVILRLCDKGYIVKTFDKNDRRAFVVSLTPEAKKIISRMEEMAGKVTETALQGVHEDERQVLYKTLNKIIKNLSEEDTI